MMRVLAIVFGLMLVASVSFAGENPQGELAMHVVASGDFLYCPELTTPGGGYFPLDCLGIDNDATPAELAAAYGYAYVVLCCYNVTGITGVEYCITGFPVARDGSPAVALNYCPTESLVLGDPLVGGGIQTFGLCLEPDPLAPCGGMVGFAWIGLLASQTVTPDAVWSYLPSAYSFDPGYNYFLDCTTQYEIDPAVSEHGCTINGVHWEPVPYDDCHPDATATEKSTWSNVKSMYR